VRIKNIWFFVEKNGASLLKEIEVCGMKITRDITKIVRWGKGAFILNHSLVFKSNLY
jgi:hypothetical protein